jgi:hypothetical protein
VLENEAPTLMERLSGTSWLVVLWSRYLEVLREMFDKLESWEGIAAYTPLNQVFEVLLHNGGLQLSKLPTGGYYAKFVATKTL